MGHCNWGTGPLLESDGSGNLQREFIFAGGRHIARRDITGGAVHYYFTDNLASTDVVTTSTGALENDSAYYPFGSERAYLTSLANQNYKFNGKERDSESGLDELAPDIMRIPWADSQSPTGQPSRRLYRMRIMAIRRVSIFTAMSEQPHHTCDPDGHDALWVVDKQTGQTTLVIPVHYTGSGATSQDVTAITNRISQLNTGGSNVTIQVVPTDKPMNGVLNTLSLSPGKDSKYAATGAKV